MNTSPTQCQAILDRLTLSPGEWVAMPLLAHHSGSLNVHSRVDELRHKRGVMIENKKERDACNRRRTLSSYRLVEEAQNPKHEI